MKHFAWVLALGVLAGSCAPGGLGPFDTVALRSLTEEVDSERVWSHLTALSAAHLEDTPFDCSVLSAREKYPELCHISNTRARDYMRQELEALGLVVRSDALSAEGLPTENLIADWPGTSRAEEVVLVGAHFDAYYGGADDNSSGVAAVLELARVLSGHRFARTVRFVGFDLEELGLVGSNRYVDTLGGEALEIALVLDCIGYYSTQRGSQRSLPGLPSPSEGDFLALISNDRSSRYVSEANAQSGSLGLMKTVAMIAPGEGHGPLTGSLQLSDHSAFWLTGRRAVFFTDTANFRNPNYHLTTDLPETLDKGQLTQATRVVAAAVAHWAGLEP